MSWSQANQAWCWDNTAKKRQMSVAPFPSKRGMAWLLLILKPEPYWFGDRGVEDSRVWPLQSNCQATVVSEGLILTHVSEQHLRETPSSVDGTHRH